MRIDRGGNSYLLFKHIFKNSLKNNKSVDNKLILAHNNNLIRNKRSVRLQNRSSPSNNDTSETNRGVLSRYLDNLKCKVNVWGSSLVELEVKLEGLKYIRSRNRFLRKFAKIELVSNGLTYAPNEIQLFSLRPQLTGCDLLLNCPKGSGKTFLYLLPHLVYNYLFNNYDNEIKSKLVNYNNQKVVILLPTIDLVLDDSRVANGCFRKYKRVASLLYKNIALNDLTHVMDSDIIYSTPKSFLKLLVSEGSVRSSVRFVVVDESERMIVGEFAHLLVRIKNLLPVDSQYIFLSNFNHNHLLHQFTSRFLKVNFKIISFVSDSENRNKIMRHIYGPIRNIDKHISIYNSINSNELKDGNLILNMGLEDDSKPNLIPEDSSECNMIMGQNKENIHDNSTTVRLSSFENISKEVSLQADGPTRVNTFKRVKLRVNQNRDLLLNTKNRVALNDYKIEYVLYEPSRFMDALLSELDANKKTLIYFPTVRMCQSCYIYVKHYLRAFDNCDKSRVNESRFSANKCYEGIDDKEMTYEESSGITSNNNVKSENTDSSTRNDDVCPENTDRFMFYAFHTALSLEKRRYVVDNFKLATRGFLFCTNLGIGINFSNVNKIIQVSFAFDIYELLNKFSHPVRILNGRIGYTDTINDNKDESGFKQAVENVLLLNTLDGHILHEYYKNDISVTYKNSFTLANHHSKNNPDGDSNDFTEDTSSGNNRDHIQLDNTHGIIEHLSQNKQVDMDVYLLHSCELMYRSLLGYYSENAKRLKLDRWMIPSFFNEFLKSFGVKEPFSVSKQFAARTQLLDSPGLEVSRSSNRKSDLIAALKAYPGFISKSKQSNISV